MLLQFDSQDMQANVVEHLQQKKKISEIVINCIKLLVNRLTAEIKFPVIPVTPNCFANDTYSDSAVWTSLAKLRRRDKKKKSRLL